jgi:hypothetical protein
MSNFNPIKRRTAQDWEELAVESIEKSDNNFGVGGAIVAGLVLGTIANPLTGVLGAGLILYASFRKTKSVNNAEEAIREYKCVAPFLSGNNLEDYISQIGQDEVMKQVTWAQERGYEISSDAKKLVPKQVAAQLQTSIVASATASMGMLQAVFAGSSRAEALGNTQSPTPNVQDLISAMAVRPRNHLIVGQQGCGKGLIVSNALSAIKRIAPKLIVYYIDPKGDDKETGYFGNVDVLERGNALQWKDSKTIEWFKAKFQEFMQLPSPKLLVFDEATTISILIKNGGETGWLKGAIAKLTSLGDSGQAWVWILAQNSNCEDFGVSGGLRSQFTALALVHESGITSYEAMRSTKWLPIKSSPEEIIQLCNSSPVKRCYFYGQFNDWLPMPKLPNPSGYDRDGMKHLEQSFNQDSRPPKLSEMAQKLLDYLVRTGRTEALIKDVQPSFKVGGERFKSEQIKQWFYEIINTGLAVWLDENTIKIRQTDRTDK